MGRGALLLLRLSAGIMENIMRCKAETKYGTRCRVNAESDGYCHVHSPHGLWAKQHPSYRVKDYVEDAEEDWGLRPGETLIGEMREGEWVI